MNNRFFLKLAADNIKKNGKNYIPYIMTCMVTVAMYYMIRSLSLNPGLEDMVGASTIQYTMLWGSKVIALFACIFLFYTNSFLVKRRKKEFGVFHILGMEKRHLAKTLAWETFYIAVISFVCGIVLGIALDKIMFLLIIKVIGGEIMLGFFVSPKAISSTLLLFAVIYLFIYLHSVHQIHAADPIDLLHGGEKGEKEPKTKVLLAVLGLLCVGLGYYIALTTNNPVASIGSFFVAVFLVIIGTYLLFTAGSVAFLKLLRKNKKYYYQTRHFTSVSGMIYRMKQNAVGLANICVLSTMVLVMISAVTSLMLGLEDALNNRHPNDFVLYSDETDSARREESFLELRKLQEENHLKVTKEIQYRYLAFTAVHEKERFLVGGNASIMATDEMTNLFFVPLSDFNTVMGTEKTLKDGEILLYSNRQAFDYPVLKVFDRNYTIKETLKEFLGNGLMAANIAQSQFIVVPDMEEIEELYLLQKEALADISGNIRYFYGFDTDAGKQEQEDFYHVMQEWFAARGYQGTIESKADSRTGAVGLYGGFFFIGIFLGILFVMATVLIIYYKQISEGYEDKERFAIMQKVGMSHQEVKASIHSQVLTMFFLPLLVAGIHTTAAFPLTSKLLELLNLFNTKLYITCIVVVFLAFTVMYLLVYLLTAKVYYRIVSR